MIENLVLGVKSQERLLNLKTPLILSLEAIGLLPHPFLFRAGPADSVNHSPSVNGGCQRRS
jgi:hypothetical protein